MPFSLIMQSGSKAGDPGFFIVMMIVLFIFMYFMSIRPQQQRMKKHRELLASIVRGDTIVTNGGLIGKVKKVNDDDLTVAFGDNDMKVVKTMVADVRGRTATAPANDTSKPKKKSK